jgi:hypothetical protein
MALGYNTYYALPHLRDYAEASKWEQDVKPIRGDELQRKPLGRRDQKWRRIRREEDNSIVILEDWGQSPPFANWYIRYTPNGELHLYDDAPWCKASRNEVMQRVTGITAYTQAGRAWASYDGGVVPLNQRSRKRWENGKYVKEGKDPEPSIFVRNERGYWVCKNPPTIMTHVVNRKGAKAVRQRYASGLAYVDALAKLRGNDVPKHEELVAAFRDTLLKELSDEELRAHWSIRNKVPPVWSHGRFNSFTHNHAEQLATLLGSYDPGDQYKAYVWLMRDEYENGRAIKNAEKVLMMVHHDEWLTKREAPAGKKAIDRYKWAFPKQA